MLTEGGQTDLVGIAPGKRHGFGEGRLEEPGGISGDDETLEPFLLDLVGKTHRVQFGSDAKTPYPRDVGQVVRVRLDRVKIDRAQTLRVFLTDEYPCSHTPPV